MKEKILIIDREPDNRKILENFLNKKGYQTSGVCESKAVIDILKSESFELVIMDINLPGSNGLQLVRDIKELEDSIEVIVLTGLNSTVNAVQALRHNGAFDFLIKPLESTDQLINSIEKALKNKDRIKK